MPAHQLAVDGHDDGGDDVDDGEDDEMPVSK